MTIPSDLTLYIVFLVWGVYFMLIAPYFGSKILMKTGHSERYWYFILVILNVWALLVILFRPSFRKGLLASDNLKLILLACGYPVFFAALLYVLG